MEKGGERIRETQRDFGGEGGVEERERERKGERERGREKERGVEDCSLT